jgi:hypothetical protein
MKLHVGDLQRLFNKLAGHPNAIYKLGAALDARRAEVLSPESLWTIIEDLVVWADNLEKSGSEIAAEPVLR